MIIKGLKNYEGLGLEPRVLNRFIGSMPIEEVHVGTLQPYLAARKKTGVKSGTVSRELAVVRRILTLVWCDDKIKPLIDTVPLLELPK
jgi:hypothetical protein